MPPRRKTRSFDPPVPAHLNSVWLEGELVTAPASPSGARTFHLRLPHEREGDGILVKASEAAIRNLPPAGGRVRVLGRLAQHRWADATGRSLAEVSIWGELVEADP